MPSSLISRDSPRAQHGRRRAPRGQLARSGSLFGAIKNIVTAPLAWLTSYDDHENVSGKRGRNAPTVIQDEGVYHEDQPSAKRKRVDSPEPALAPPQHSRTTQGYLDVPENLLPPQPTARQRPGSQFGHGRSSSLVTSLAVPSAPGAHPGRRTASPAGIMSFTQPPAMQRTQSMDPPAYRALSLSRDVSMEDGVSGFAGRDVTMSPSRHTPFQLRARSSMTPQPTGQTFGPTPRHKERDVSEPPPLAALMSKPIFVKPPPQMTQPQSEQPVTTLGSIAEATGRISRSPMRQHSGLFFGARPGSIAESSATPYGMPINAAEKALHDLDVYKTPLLPSRLRGSQTIPEMFKPKKTKAPVLMRTDHEQERKPRLGMSERKGKGKEEEVAAPKPYAGRGGMKKMLARRKEEEEEELEKERANAIETDQEEVTEVETMEAFGKAPETKRPSPPPAPAPPARPVGGREQSSLRVGRTRTSRNHIARPVSKSKNRFSAVFDEEEGEEFEEVVEEPKKLPTLFESPKGFSFAQDKAPVLLDSSNAKEPPIAALPFSLTKPSAAATAAPALAPPVSFAEPPKAPAPAAAPAVAETPAPKAAEAAPAVPSISLIPPSPAPAKPVAEPSVPTVSLSTPPSIPDFFANSSIFSKPGVSVAPSVPALAPESAAATLMINVEEVKQEIKSAAPPSLFGGLPSFAVPAASARETPLPSAEARKPATPVPVFSFGVTTAASATTSTISTVQFPSPTAKDTAVSETAKSLFAPTQPAPAAPESKLVPPAPKFTFGTPAEKPVEKSTAPSSLPFSFGVPAAANGTTAAPPATAQAPSPFSFGQPKAEPSKPAEAKPLFGAAPVEAAKPSLFGAPAPSPSPFGGPQGKAGAEVPKPAFTFGAPSTPAPSVEAPKPLFPSTSTGGTGGFGFGPTAPSAPSPVTPAKSPFTFPSTPSVSTPTENKPAFTFGVSATPSAAAPATLLGGPSAGSNAADVSKPFTFGAPARPLTPPHKEQEMRMEESPIRNNAMDINGAQPQAPMKPSGVFAFGGSTSTTSPFGQPSQPASSAFAFGQKTEATTGTKPAAGFGGFGQGAPTSAFAFGQKAAESARSPISPAPFGTSAPFGQAAGTPTSTTSPFAFGAPSTATGGFGSSQPASPSTFGQQPSPFAYTTPTSATAPSNPFAFGSQPASPATGSAGLPQPPGSSGGPAFTFGVSSSTSQSPSSPFGAAPSLPQPAGAVSFTIGSSAPQQPAGGGARAIKKLPTRRGGRPR